MRFTGSDRGLHGRLAEAYVHMGSSAKVSADVFSVIGYVYDSKAYCLNCIVDALKKDGLVYRHFRVTNLDDTLDSLALHKEIERNDVWEYDTSEVPKEILSCDTEYDIDICTVCDTIIGV